MSVVDKYLCTRSTLIFLRSSVPHKGSRSTGLRAHSTNTADGARSTSSLKAASVITVVQYTMFANHATAYEIIFVSVAWMLIP